MTEQIALLDDIKHLGYRVNVNQYDVAHNRVNVAVVTMSELVALVHEYPIFITKSPTTGHFQLTALLGLIKGVNSFIQEGNWVAKYVPIDIQRRPFQAFFPENTKEKKSGRIIIDLNDEQVQKQQGELIFDEAGEPTEYFNKIKSMFGELMSNAEQSKPILNLAVEHDLFEPIEFEFEVNNEKRRSPNGLYTINKDALSNLTGTSLEHCYKSGVIEVCHLVMSSAIHIEKLVEWANSQ